jgi:hypothetical protein
MSVAIRQTQTELPPVVTRYRFAWDNEIPDYNYKCRTQSEGFIGPDNPPAVLRFYPSMSESGDYRVNLEKDPAWHWRDTIVFLNGGNDEAVRRVDYWTNPNTAQFNTTGWAKMAYLGMCGNEINVLERVGEWICFETLKPTEWGTAREMTFQSHPQYIHSFSCVTWKIDPVTGQGYTKHIESTGTPRGQVFYPLVTNEGFGWIPSRFVVKA